MTWCEGQYKTQLICVCCVSPLESVASVPVSEAPTESGFSMADYTKVNGRLLFLRQFQALFIKRFHHLRRSKKGFFFEVCSMDRSNHQTLSMLTLPHNTEFY